MEKKYFAATIGCEGGCDVAELTIWQDNNSDIAVHKTVSYDGYCEALLKNRTHNNAKKKLGLLPKEVLSIMTGEREQIIYCFIPGEVRFLAYRKRCEETMGYMIPYPSMIMEITRADQSARPTSVWCVKQTVDWPDDTTPLYRFPFSNVSDNGSICMGGNSVQLTGNEKLSEVVKKSEALFFDAPYNGDYYAVGNKVNSMMSLGDLLTSLHGKREFPEELLISTQKTVMNLGLD